uniref:Putative secreted protein n=1 Tax=Ixodes ricinus TaxID=34613 RepID=A0A6B0UT98_IXORI
MAASSSTASCESRLLRMLWWRFLRSATISAMLPSVLSVSARATGSLLYMTEKMRRTNSSMLRILSRCLSLCCITFSTSMRRKLVPTRNTSASFRQAELMRIGNGYFSKRRGKRTIVSHCSPSLPERRPLSSSVSAELAS